MNANLPKVRKLIRSILLETMQSHTDQPELGDNVRNVNQGCNHFGSEGQVIDVYSLPEDTGIACDYQCTNAGPNWDIGDILSKTLDQLEKVRIELEF